MKRDPVPGFDSITGLPNRRLFLTKISDALNGAHRGELFAVLSLQLDQFNAIHLQIGTEKADQLLAAAGGRIQHALGYEGFLARVQHHEFGILLMDVADAADAQNLSQNIQNSFGFPFNIDNSPIELTASIGIVLGSRKHRNSESVWREAHVAACEMKRKGGDRVGLYGFSIGTQVGRFQITSFLGKGGMGEVYCAYDSMLNREVAIKVLHENVCKESVPMKRFQRELQTIGALSHPNIIALYDIGSIRGRIYAVMERLRGNTLRDILKAGHLSAEQSYEYAIQISEGLAAAHDKGIMHRDLKPENVFVTEDQRIKILDFGLARFTHWNRSDADKNLLDTISRVTEPGLLLGTVAYMSPEQIRGDEMDQRCDVFSFGSLFYEMLCGEPAFEKSHTIDTFSAILKEEPSELYSDKIPDQIKYILGKCLRKQMKHRYPSARELNEALKTAIPDAMRS